MARKPKNSTPKNSKPENEPEVDASDIPADQPALPMEGNLADEKPAPAEKPVADEKPAPASPKEDTEDAANGDKSAATFSKDVTTKNTPKRVVKLPGKAGTRVDF